MAFWGDLLGRAAQLASRAADSDDFKQGNAEREAAEVQGEVLRTHALELHREMYPEQFSDGQPVDALEYQGVSFQTIMQRATLDGREADKEAEQWREDRQAAMEDYRLQMELMGRGHCTGDILRAAGRSSDLEFYGTATSTRDPVARARASRREYWEDVARRADAEYVGNLLHASDTVNPRPGLEGWARRAGASLGGRTRGTAA